MSATPTAAPAVREMFLNVARGECAPLEHYFFCDYWFALWLLSLVGPACNAWPEPN